ncbi:Hint domain-containing protein [Actibacterium ureilyticum]|uniref:Hint domain-containing protein n=1 Tax=Actibacterium ureilyticum TaxID=1590614 RepID=UPI000BAAE9BF|nr:Hint domain-containing protein [Actibacterium ureilyticum]
MAGETFLLSGDQIATYTSSTVTFPGGLSTIQLNGLSPLGDADSRFFLIRVTGDTPEAANGQFFAVYPAVDDGSGNLVPGAAPVVSANFATPDAYTDTGAGDDYIIFGLFGGTQFAVNLNGFDGATEFVAVQGQDLGGSDADGELDMTEVAAANPDLVVCFVRGTLIDTPAGPRRVEDLSVGTLVDTLDHGPRPICWIAGRQIPLGGANPALRPVRIGADAMGPGVPDRDVLLSPAHRVMVRSGLCDLYFGQCEVFVPARFLLGRAGITVADGLAQVEYWHFMFDRHEIVRASGLPVESFFPGTVGASHLSRAARAELYAIFPELRHRDWQRFGTTARKTLKRFEAALLPRR